MPNYTPLVDWHDYVTIDPSITDPQKLADLDMLLTQMASTTEGVERLQRQLELHEGQKVRIVNHEGMGGKYNYWDHTINISWEPKMYIYLVGENGEEIPWSLNRSLFHEMDHAADPDAANTEINAERDERAAADQRVQHEINATQNTNAYMAKYFGEPPRATGGDSDTYNECTRESCPPGLTGIPYYADMMINPGDLVPSLLLQPWSNYIDPTPSLGESVEPTEPVEAETPVVTTPQSVEVPTASLSDAEVKEATVGDSQESQPGILDTICLGPLGLAVVAFRGIANGVTTVVEAGKNFYHTHWGNDDTEMMDEPDADNVISFADPASSGNASTGDLGQVLGDESFDIGATACAAEDVSCQTVPDVREGGKAQKAALS